MMWDYGYGGGWIWMTILMVVFIAAVVVAIVFLVRALGGSSPGAGERSPYASEQRRGALDILERRYAAGEIDREEYLQKRQDLTG